MPSEAVRRRKLAQNDEGSRPPPLKRRTQSPNSKGGLPQGLKLSFFCLIACVLLILFTVGFYMDTMSPIFERLATKLGYEKSQYAVIIDAGSTGSRVIAYKFHRSILDNKLILDDELFKERKPGLSAFADNPSEGAASIRLLLEDAKFFIPKKSWVETPLVLKATAGLRLLPPAKAASLLNGIRNLFAKSEFSVDENAVEIMEGTDEGLFSWFTVNFLLGKLTKTNQAAALDLGGGSTQVTFSPADPAQVPIYEGYVHSVHTTNREISVFTHSYLGLGLMAVRHALFTKRYPKNQTMIVNECVNPIVKNKTFIYLNVEYHISGAEYAKSTAENPIVDFDKCLESIKSIVLPLVKPKPLTLKQHAIAAFSYYFDRAIESGLVDPFKGGEINVEDYRTKAMEVCATPNTDQPFMCTDLTYISVLLREGFGLDDKKRIKLYNKIDGHEVSWALGCAYHVLTTNERYNS